MLKRIAFGASLVAGVLLLLVVFLGTRLRDERKIARAEFEAEMLRTQRDSILRVVAINDSLQRELSFVRNEMEVEASRLLGRIDELERARVANQLSVRRLRRTEDLRARIETTFPEMAASRWGVTEVFDDANGVGIEYLMVPLWFSETFLIDHQNSLAYRTQVDTFRVLDGLRQQISQLQDSVLTLERGSRLAYQNGYDTAYQLYQSLNREYIDELKRPRFDLGVPGGIATMLGSFGAGALMSTVVR
jgi:hypothetical protein